MRPFVLFASLFCASAVHADLAVTFSEGAPKDRFTFEAVGGCMNGPTVIELDLAGSDAGLIFDVTGSGAGVEVFQPFELVAGGALLAQTPKVEDGDTSLRLNLTGLAQGAEVAFTIDRDDTLGGREITVNGSEIKGAVVRVTTAEGTQSGEFGSDAKAIVAMAGCKS